MTMKSIHRAMCQAGVLAASLALFFITGCGASRGSAPGVTGPAPTGRPASVPDRTSDMKKFEHFIAVTVQPGDTLSTLAATYLQDPALDRRIAQFNGVTSAQPGESLVIPLAYSIPGGLTERSYQTVPVLAYHKFSEQKGNKMTITRQHFEQQMRFLKDGGYRAIGLDELLDFLDFRRDLPEKAVAITIDDGWRSFYDIGYPILRKYGFTATLFVYTDMITGSKTTLSWEQIKEMSENGVDIQVHSKTHRNMAKPTGEEDLKAYLESLEREIDESSRLIKKKIGKETRHFAYPFSDTNGVVIALLKKRGFRGGYTVKRGANPFFVNNHRIRRSMIFGDYSLEEFEKNLVTRSRRALR